MQIQPDNKPYDDINITPMLDLAYVLLIIFIVMTTATVQGMKVNLPKASASPSLAQQTTKAITVGNDGKIYLDTIPVMQPLARPQGPPQGQRHLREPEQQCRPQPAQRTDQAVRLRTAASRELQWRWLCHSRSGQSY